MSSPDHALGAPRSWRTTLAGYLALARISNSPTVVSNVLAGAALAGVTRPDATVALLAVAMVLFYTAGMVLNDVCDYEYDCRRRPTRPLPAGVVSRSAAAALVVALFALGGGLLWLAGPGAFLSGLVLIGLIVLYDVWHKTNPLSPLVMAGCRLLVYVTAFAAFAWPPGGGLLLAGGLLLLYLVGLTAIAKSEDGPALAKYWPAALLFLPPLVLAVQMPHPALLVLPLLVAGWVASSITVVYRPQRDIGGAIARLIAGIALVDGLVLATAGALAGVALALAAFGLTLFFQRYIQGT